MSEGIKTPAIISDLSSVWKGTPDDSHIGTRLRRMVDEAQRVEAPPFPRQIQVETTNICNHQCDFCAYTTMKRPKRHMDQALFEQIVLESYTLGAREIGLFAGAEPLACKKIGEYITYCRDLGYEYIYISTNGALGDTQKMQQIIDAGLSSIKFSINAGDRETYKNVHGRDDFDKVIENVQFVRQYIENNKIDLWLGVSFVGMPHTDHTFENLKGLVGEFVDEIIYYEASNQSGQMPEFPDPPYRDCHLPFNKAHFSLEGYIKACCNDYENLLAVEDIKPNGIAEAWHSERFKTLRRAHITDDMDGTLCANCIRRSTQQAEPLNPALVTHLPSSPGKNHK